MAQLGPAFAEFGQRLRRARQRRFATATALARELSWSQSRVSKLETGQRLPRDDELATWAEVVGLDGDRAEELYAALGTARIEHALRAPRDDRARSGGSSGGPAEGYLQRVRADYVAAKVVEYAPAILPLMVATPEYTAAVAGPLLGHDLAPGMLRSIQQQRIKHQELLYQQRTEVVLVIEADTLHHPAVAADVAARQRDRLLALAELPTLSVEVCAQRRPGHTNSALVIHDDRTAIVGGPLAGERVEDPVDAAGWAQVMAGYRDHALRGEHARAHIRHARPGQTAA